MPSDTVYVVTAYRWGDYDNHSYVVGIFSNEALALTEAEMEEKHRGGKYECEIQERLVDVVDDPLNPKIIKDVSRVY